MNARTLILLLAVALVSAAVTYTITTRGANGVGSGAAEAAHDEQGSEGAKIAGLKTAAAVAGEGWDTIEATGKLMVPPDRLVKISPRIQGKIVAAHGTVGDAVRRGQVLAVISSVELAEARSDYRQAAAKLKAARDNFARELQIAELSANSLRPVEEARSEGLTASSELADAKSEFAQANSELTREESELVQCKAKLERARELYADKIVSKQDVESAEAEYKRDSAAVDAAKSKVSQAEARIGTAQSKVEIAKQYLTREEKVYKGRVVDMRALQNAKAEVDGARIAVQAAADRIRVLGASPGGSGETIAITSPIAGRIVSRNTNVGEMASPEQSLFTVADLSHVSAEADVYEKDLARVRLGQRVEMRIDTYPDRVFTGTVDSVSDVLSPDSRTAKIRCDLVNAGGLLRGEMFAKLSIIVGRRGRTVLIPKEAVLDDAGKKVVFAGCMSCPEDRETGKPCSYDKLEVTTGSVRGGNVEILSGIDPGALVVTTGAHQLKAALGSGQLKAGCKDDCGD